MTNQPYDVIVIGARCAGAPTAMLLARQGLRTLVVDRATFPSDTISTHLIHPPGMDLLRRWGLYDRVVATNCPPIDSYTFDFGQFVIKGDPRGDALPESRAPRRTVLDQALVEAAREAGAEVREAFTVEEIVMDNERVVGIRGHERGGKEVTERAGVVIGADGRHSLLARTVKPEQYNEKPELLAAYYTYWRDLPLGGFEAYVRPYESFAAWPTNDGLTLVIAGWQFSKFEENKKDIEGNYLRVVGLAPEFARKLKAARREERYLGAAVPGYFRKPYGAGWALVGDAGYNRDFITAQGIQDAFRDADMCATALHQTLSGQRSFESAMSVYQKTRDERLPMYEFTAGLASQEPPPPETQQLLAAVARDRHSMDQFVQVNAGVLSPAEFFSEENVKRIFAAAQ